MRDGLKILRDESKMSFPDSGDAVSESEMSVFESNTDIFVCRLVLYSSIAYGLLRNGVVCSGLLRETGRPRLFGAFLPALHGLRLIAQTTAAETAFGCRRFMVCGS
ncbi:MAG: hypothetical protein LBD13_02085 [Spirochaetaceae bacterium]|nr:hypothetical protein [Spirochaetaceae bacterium]